MKPPLGSAEISGWEEALQEAESIGDQFCGCPVGFVLGLKRPLDLCHQQARPDRPSPSASRALGRLCSTQGPGESLNIVRTWWPLMETLCDVEATARLAVMPQPKDPWMLDTEPLSCGQEPLGEKELGVPSGPL